MGWGVHVKNHVQQSPKEKKKKVEALKTKKRWWWRGGCETVFLLISSTDHMANIILDDGHFTKER